jgi:hypothetical protein
MLCNYMNSCAFAAQHGSNLAAADGTDARGNVANGVRFNIVIDFSRCTSRPAATSRARSAAMRSTDTSLRGSMARR